MIGPTKDTAHGTNPYAAPPSEDRQVRVDVGTPVPASGRRTISLMLAAAIIAATIPAAATAVAEIESIAVSGPAFAVACTVLSVRRGRRRDAASLDDASRG